MAPKVRLVPPRSPHQRPPVRALARPQIDDGGTVAMRVPVPGGGAAALAALGETERTGRPQTADSEEVEAAVVIQGVTRQKFEELLLF